MTEHHNLIINCGDATHTVEIKADALQRVHCTLVDHDEELDQVLRALGAERSACLKAADAVRNLRNAIPSVATRIQWVETGVHDVHTYKHWCDVGASNPGAVRHWVSALTQKGSPPPDLAQAHQEVCAWWRHGITRPLEVGRWVQAGLDPGRALQWTKAGLSTADAAAWTAAGVSELDEVAGWHRLGVLRPDDRAAWSDVEVTTGRRAGSWAGVGVSRPDEVAKWRSYGVTLPEEVAAWAGAGIDITTDQGLAEIVQWTSLGLSAHETQAWLGNGDLLDVSLTPDDIASWRAHGVHTGADLLHWVTVGVTRPEDLEAWRAAGVFDARTAEVWGKAHVRSLADLQRWARAGITLGDEAYQWTRDKFITCPEEAGAWRKANFSNPSWARTVLHNDRQQVPEHAMAVRQRGFYVLEGPPATPEQGFQALPAWVTIGPARASAHPRAVTTERYFYGYGWPCRPEAATNVTEQDFDDNGDEVSRRPRPWFPTIRVSDDLEEGG